MNRRLRMMTTADTGGGTGEEVDFSSASVLEGTVIDGSSTSAKSCEDTYWQIEATGNGINVIFTFSVLGQSKKVKIKGKWAGGGGGTVLVQAWDGLSWTTVQTVSESLDDNTYTVNLDSQYTIDNQTRVRVYRATGSTNSLYLDCIHIISEGTGTPVGGPGILTNDSIETIGAGTASFGADDGEFLWNVGAQFLDKKVVFHLDVSSLPSFTPGQLIVDITCDSGSLDNWNLSNSNSKNPDLSASTSSPNTSISSGQTQRGIGSTAVTFQDGYFSIYVSGNGPFSGSAHISAVYWNTGNPYPGGTLNDLWIAP